MALLASEDLAPRSLCPTEQQDPPREPLCPSASDLLRALALLDMNRDGKVWEDDLDALLDLACLDASSPEGASAAAEWQRNWGELKAVCRCSDGLLSVDALRTSIDMGLLQALIAKRPTTRHEGGSGSSQSSGAANGAQQKQRGVCELLDMFNKFDSDRNGVICAKDLQRALASLTEVQFSKDECRDIIRRADGNCNGVVELREFPALLNSVMYGQ